MNEVVISGNSGCTLDIIDGKVFKYTNDDKYVNRLKIQCAKQKFFFDLLSYNSHIQVPKVFKEDVYSKNGYGFYMQYLHADNFITFFENYDIQHILLKIDIILKFIDENISTSKMIIVDKKLIEKKINSLYSIFLKSDILRRYIMHITDVLQKLYLFDKFKFPIGVCHGDLTFSNILFKKHNIVLIDFLDNFIETPMQDIVKLRQDTKHKWSLNMTCFDYDEVKIKI
ncbi:TPA: hypothetical protein SG285_001542, partial [Campylobacter coli]|nr:hypothetical protein [Campylobacter coli]